MENNQPQNANKPDIRIGPDIILTPEVKSVLQKMFTDYYRISVKAELGGGFSGSYIYQVSLVEAGHNDELAIVKIAPASLIEQEQRAYKKWVERKLPNTAHVDVSSALSEDGLWKGLRYTIAGGGIFSVQSLYDYYQTSDIEAIATLMEKRLFEVLGRRWWWNNRTETAFQMQTNYDDLLPLNLIIKHATPPAQATLTIIKTDDITSSPIVSVGTWVQLGGFVVTKLNPTDGEITLNLPPRAGADFSPSFRVRVIGVDNIADYPNNQPTEKIRGYVEATQHSLLESYVRQAFGEIIDPTTIKLALTTDPVFSPATLYLPNPLQTYQTLLQDFIEVRISTVHGDLNFENILVDPQISDFILIDFATVQLGHALHDLLRLETEVVIKLIPPILKQAKLPPETMFSVYEHLYLTTETDDYSPELPEPALNKPFRLLQLIRKTARRCLIDPDNWDEYYRSLTIYLLGALKYTTVRHSPLAPLPAQTAFWGAAVAQQLLQDPPGAQQIPASLSYDISEQGIDIEAPFGTMPPDSKFYIERTVDQLCRERITAPQTATIFIQAPRQMGKSSLIQRVIKQVKDAKIKQVAFVDFQKFPESYIDEEDQFFKEFCLMLGDSLNLTETIEHSWQPKRSHILNCSRYVSRYIIPQLKQPLVLALDEVERMLFSPFRSNFFGMLRTWHNDRAFDENFAQLTLFLSSSTEPYLFIDNPHQSPFNVAETYFLENFTRSEVEDLNRRHGSPLNHNQIGDLTDLVNGHPFLTRVALYWVSKKAIDSETLMVQATEDTGPFGNHLRHYLRRVLQQPELKRALVRICREETCDEDQTFFRLQGAGLVRKQGQRVVLRNQLYTRYFKERLNV